MHHQTPQWEQHVLKDNCWHGLNFSIWDKLDDWQNKANVKLLDTTNSSITTVAQLVSKWIKKTNFSDNGIQQQ